MDEFSSKRFGFLKISSFRVSKLFNFVVGIAFNSKLHIIGMFRVGTLYLKQNGA